MVFDEPLWLPTSSSPTKLVANCSINSESKVPEGLPPSLASTAAIVIGRDAAVVDSADNAVTDAGLETFDRDDFDTDETIADGAIVDDDGNVDAIRTAARWPPKCDNGPLGTAFGVTTDGMNEPLS